MISLSQVLEWKYGPVAGTKQKNPDDKSENPEMIISFWNHPELPKPTKAQIQTATEEYEAYFSDLQDKKQAISDGLKALKESNKDKAKEEIPDKDVMDYYRLKMAEEILL